MLVSGCLGCWIFLQVHSLRNLASLGFQVWGFAEQTTELRTPSSIPKQFKQAPASTQQVVGEGSQSRKEGQEGPQVHR